MDIEKKTKRAEIMKKINRGFFIDRLADLGMTQRGLAKALDIDSGALSNMLHGRRKMMPAEAVKIAEVLKIQLDDVLAAAGVVMTVPKGLRVHLCVDELSNVKVYPGSDLGFEVSNPGVPTDSLIVQVRNRLSPLDGWLMFFTGTPSSADVNLNHVCMVETAHGSSLVATLIKGYRSNTYNLISFVGNDRPIREDIEINRVHPLLLIKPI